MIGVPAAWLIARARGARTPALAHPPSPRRPRALGPRIAAIFVAALAAAGCGVDEQRHTPPLGQGGDDSSSGSGIAVCTEGAQRDCHATLSHHGDVLTCLDGVERCVNGRWGACTDGETRSYRIAVDDSPRWSAADPSGGLSPKNLTDAGPCTNNPCDPTCQSFNETPLAGSFVALAPWSTGSIIGLSAHPSGVSKVGLRPPCSTAADCQFNEYCDSPSSGTCSHDKCAPGDPLVSGCDPCVTSICAANPACCVNPPGCLTHDVCAQGAGLSLACGDACVASVCATKPSCCSTSWDASCVALVPAACGGKSCASWDASCVAQVHDTCGDICETSVPACAHDTCLTGGPLTSGCDPCVAQVCAANPSCCTNAWDASCVTQVASTCGKSCPVSGLCRAWIPGMSDTKCNGPDLTVGIPCSWNTIPICNVGSQTAPAGIKVVAYAAGTGFSAGGANVCNPGAPTRSYGTTTVPIPPGGCVDIFPANMGSISAPVASDEILVNPPGAGHVNECQCQNNWSIFPAGPFLGCEPLSCAGPQSGTASQKPNMVLSVERSSAIPSATFAAMKTGFNTFFQNNTRNVGLGVALGFFPDLAGGLGINCNTATCDQAQCKLRVPLLLSLSAAAGASDNEETALVSTLAPIAVDVNPAPAGAALQAGIAAAKTYMGSNAGQPVVEVLVMASEPSTCNPPAPPPASLATAASLAGVASNAFVSQGIKTYVIGVGPSISVATINTIANAGGGKAFAIKADANLATNLTSALLAIRNDIFPCSFALPAAGLFDPTSITVGYIPGGGFGQSPLPQYADAASCGSPGFYLDNNANPTKVILCPQTCTDVNTYDPSWGTSVPFVKVKVACPAANQNQVYTDNCPKGTRVQWGFLGWDTTTPAGTSVNFQVRTATSAAALSSATFITAGTAKPSPNTQQCPLGASCAVDLFKALGGPPGANNRYLELSLTLNQNIALGLTPAVNNWKITYSCPPSE